MHTPAICIADDDDAVRKTWATALREAGHKIFEAADGEDVLNLIDRQAVALVVLDILMPRKEGLETIAGIKSRSPDTKILAVSGGGDSVQAGDALYLAKRFGANAVLQKPFRIATLLEQVNGLLRG
jgi:DNA-binding response OmpR family regulator